MTRKPFLPSATSANIDWLTEPICTSCTSSMRPSALYIMVKVRMLGPFHVHDGQAVLAVGDVAVRPRQCRASCASANGTRAPGIGTGWFGSAMLNTFSPSSSVTNAYWNWIATARGLRRKLAAVVPRELRVQRVLHVDHRQSRRLVM